MPTKDLDPVLMAVLANRMEGITREVLTVMLRSGRSVMLNACRDFSTAILTGDCRMLAVAEGLPVHVLTAGRAVKPILEFFERPRIRTSPKLTSSRPHFASFATTA